MQETTYSFVINPIDTTNYTIIMKSYLGDVCTRNEVLSNITLQQCFDAQLNFVNS